MASITGRMVNFMSRYLPAPGRMGTKRQVKRFRESNGANWYKNLAAAGEAHVEVGPDRWAVTVRELDEGVERDECWDLLVQGYPDFGTYQELTDRRLPVAVLERLSN